MNITKLLSLFMLIAYFSGAQAQYLTESFEGNSLPSTWTFANEGGNPWILNTSGTSNASAGSHSLQYRYNSSQAADAWAFTPAINLAEGAHVEVYFDYKSSMTFSEKLKITVGNAATKAAQTTVLWDTTFNRTAYETKKISFEVPSAGDYYFAWNCHSDADKSSLYVDKIIIQDAPTCPKPTALAASSIATTNATLTWAPGGDETQWIAEYGVEGFALGTGTSTTATNNSLSISGLTASTSYQAYVRAFCAEGDSSVWTGPVNFTTACEAMTNVNESFESIMVPALPNCWSKIVASSSSGSYYYVKTANASENNYAILRRGNNAADRVMLVSPFIENLKTNAASKWLRLKVNSTNSALKIGVLSSNSDANSFTEIKTITPTSSSNFESYELAFTSEEIDLIEDADKFIAFEVVLTSSSYGYLKLDDIIWENRPACMYPTALTLTDKGTTTADLTWTSLGSESQWEVQYGADGFTAGSGTSLSLTSNTANITGLTANTAYDAYVRAVCSSDAQSSWIGPLSFTTECDAVEDFNETAEAAVIPNLPACWKSIEPGSASAETNTSSGNKDIKIYGGSSNTARVFLVSPKLTSLKSNAAAKWLHFKMKNNSYKLKIGVMSNMADTSTFTHLLDIPSAGNSNYNLHEVTFTDEQIALIEDADQYLVFSTVKYGSIFLDDIVWENRPTCMHPTALSLNTAEATSAELTWTAGASETQWEVQYGAPGFTAGSETSQTFNSNTATITGLTPSTDYEAYVRAVCSDSDKSTWEGPISFTTACVAVENISETFETVSIPALPNCWNKITSGYVSSYYVKTVSYSSNTCVEMKKSSTASNRVVLVSPFISNLKTNAASKWLRFKMKNSNATLKIGVASSSEDASTITHLKTIAASSSSTFEDQEFAFTDEQIALIEDTDTYIVFEILLSSGYSVSLKLDDIVWENRPTCLHPTALSLNAAGATSAELTWTAGASETQWEVQYGAPGFTAGSETSQTFNSNTATITGLTPSTDYEAYVRSVCSDSDKSTWEGPISFTTNCVAENSFPYTENFSTTSLPNCWEELRTPASATKGWGTTTSGHNGKGFRFDSYSNSNGNKSRLSTNVIDLSAQTTMELRFWWKNPTGGNFRVLLSDDGGATYPNVLAENLTGVSAYQEKIINLDTYCGAGHNNVRIAFEGTSNYGSGEAYIYIDEVSVATPPTCPKPEALTVSSLEADQVSLTWTAGASETQWEVQHGAPDFTPGSGESQTVNANTAIITGLTPSTNYEAYVRAVCSSSDKSAWLGPISFTTACVAVENFNETFETVSTPALPNCWGKITSGSTYSYYVKTAGNSSNTYVEMKKGTTASNRVVLVSPYLSDLKANAASKWLHFNMKNSHAIIKIGVATSADDASTITNLKTIAANYDSDYHAHDLIFTSDEIALMEDADKYIIFEILTENSSVSLKLDDIVWENRPACITPNELSVSNFSDVSAQLQWSPRGSESEWRVQYGPSGFSLGTGDSLNATSTSQNITGLTASTDYDAYVKAICGADNQSAWVGPIAFTTTCSFSDGFNENFSGISIPNLPDCWSKLTTNTSYSYSVKTKSYSGDTVVELSKGGNEAEKVMLVSLPLNNLKTNAATNWLRFRTQNRNAPLNIGVMSSASDASTFTNLRTIAATSDYEFYLHNIVLTSEEIALIEDTDKYLAFEIALPAAAYSGSLKLDDIVWEVKPSCVKPVQFSVLDVTNSSAKIKWEAQNSESSWQIQYGATGFVLGSGTNVIVNNDTVNVDALSANTAYDVYVRAICGAGDSSIWEGPVNFATLCDYVSGLNETFETASAPDLPTCWDKYLSVNSEYYYVRTRSNLGNTFVEMKKSSASANTVALISAPIENLKADAASKWLRFKLQNEDASLKVGVMSQADDISSFTPLRTIAASGNANLNSVEITLSSAEIALLEDADKYFVFENRGNYAVIGIDDVIWEDKPDCMHPTDLSAFNINTTSASLTWTAGASETSWQVQYGTAGFTLGGGTNMIANNDTVNIGTLTANTDYEFYVRSICGVGDTSIWEGPVSFATLCETENSFPYTEDFEANTLPNCWDETRVPATASKGWFITSEGYENKGVKFNSSTNPQNNKSILSTNVLDFSSETSLELTFWWKNPTGGNFRVVLSTDGGLTYPITLANNLTGVSEYQEKIINLNDYCGASYNNVKIGFEGTSNYGASTAYISLDKVSIAIAPSCPRPQNLSLVSASSSSASINWTAGASETQWEVQYGAIGFAIGTGTTVSADNNSLEITGLTASTAYDVYVKAVCSDSDNSVWEGPLTIETLCATVNAFPYTEDFEATTMPTCWNETRTPATATKGWSSTDEGHEGKAFRFNSSFYNSEGNASLLSTPVLDLSSESNLELEFWWKNPSAGNFQVLLSNDGGTTFPVILADDLTDQATYQKKTLNLSAYCGAGNNNIRIAFKGTSNAAFGDPYIYVDDVKIQQAVVVETDIVSYSIPSSVGDAIINTDAHSIAVLMPYNTDRSALVASFTLSSGATATIAGTAQVSGTTANNWETAAANTLTYTVLGEDGTTIQDWTVMVNNEPNSANDILTFTIPNQVGESVINTDAHTVNVVMPAGVSLENLKPSFTISPEAVVKVGGTVQESGVSTQNWVAGTAVEYVVVSGTNTAQNWKVYVDNQANTETDIVEFKISPVDQMGETEYLTAEKTIKVKVKNTSDLSHLLIFKLTLSSGASATIAGAPVVAGTSIIDFSAPVTVKVTAEDGVTTADWTIKVTAESGITTQKESEFKLYPNPTKAYLNIESNLPASEWIDIEIINVSGQVVKRIANLNADRSIDLSDQANGLYLVKINTTSGSIIRKIQLNK